ncbi:MAG: hypothetical protein M0Z66_14940 [Thermaerobacter sp.]|nr:hypothetical protein [Thermaerobacter sp.]
MDTAFHAAKVWDMAPQGRYDLFVVDVRKPGEDGVTLCGHRRSTQEGAILLLTAAEAVEDRVRGLDARARGVAAQRSSAWSRALWAARSSTLHRMQRWASASSSTAAC